MDVVDGELAVTIGRGLTLWCTADLKLVSYELPVDEIPDTLTLVSGDERARLEIVRT